jgi:hypothetical protein
MSTESDKWTVEGDGTAATHAINGAQLYVWGDGYLNVQVPEKPPLRVPVWLVELLLRKGGDSDDG